MDLSEVAGRPLHISITLGPMYDVRGGRFGLIIMTDNITSQVRLRSDVEALNEQLQATNEELETTNEELQSTNEELETTNEELQSTNEELEATNEELQSTNEELETTNDELDARTGEMDTINKNLQRVQEERELARIELQRAYDRQRRIADVLQGALMSPIPDRIGDYVVRTRYRAAHEEAEVGGDFHHHARLSESLHLIALGDVSGKGLEAAVYSTMTKYILLGFVSENPSPSLALQRLNDALSGQSQDSRFVTVVYLLFDLKSGKITYGNAGHDEPVLFSAATNDTRLLQPTGRAIGVYGGGEYRMEELTLEPGDALLLYTDGLSDAGHRHKRIGAQGLADIIAQNPTADLTKLLDEIYDVAERLSGGRLVDDATSVLIRRELA